MTEVELSDSNLLIEQQLSKRAIALEEELGADVISFNGPLAR